MIVESFVGWAWCLSYRWDISHLLSRHVTDFMSHFSFIIYRHLSSILASCHFHWVMSWRHDTMEVTWRENRWEMSIDYRWDMTHLWSRHVTLTESWLHDMTHEWHVTFIESRHQDLNVTFIESSKDKSWNMNLDLNEFGFKHDSKKVTWRDKIHVTYR